MARARSAVALTAAVDSDALEIVEWYRGFLERTLPPVGLLWEPVRIGPTWQFGDAGWLLPEFSLGWDILAWCGVWLRGKGGKPWVFTAEQARFILWLYAVDASGEFVSHSAVLQRLKGWGKDPIAACLAVASLFADVNFDRWDGERPVGREDPNAWVQLVAVSQEQTKNTMKLMPGLISFEARRRYGIQIGKLAVWGLDDTRQIEAVTNSVMAIEGGRPTLIVRNETQNWNSSNGGHDMAGALEGNAAKRDIDTPARMLDICNAFRPGEDSVGQRTREAWESTLGDLDALDAEDRPKALDFGLLYDSLEAPPEAPMTAEAAPSVVEAVRGDAVWLDAKGRILKSILNTANPPSESRRKWYNQITAAEDAFTTPQLWDLGASPDEVIEPGDEVILTLDCSKSDDATGLIATRVNDGFAKVLGMWQRPPGKRGDGWLVPRDRVDGAVSEAMDSMNVVAFFGDPSHFLDDESLDRYWDAMFDDWHRRYRSRLRLWAKPGRNDGHSVMFDMAQFNNQKVFVEAVGLAEADLDAGTVLHDGDPRLRNHVLNAKRQPTRAGLSIAKDHRESKHKIDLAVVWVLGRMARRVYLNSRTKRGGRIW